MKNNIVNNIITVVLSVVFLACSDKQEIYNTPTSWLNFKLTTSADTLISYSFIYSPEGTLVDTVWIKVATSGFVKDNDRKIVLVQMEDERTNAVAGIDYLSFNDPAYSSFYVIPAGKTDALIPVIVKWNSQLEEREVVLAVGIQENEDFLVGFSGPKIIKIKISDQLSKPSNWNSKLESYIPYGKVKHEFIIRTTEEKWDDEYLSEVLGFEDNGTNSNYDVGYMTWLVKFLQRELDKENAARIVLGKEVLKEAEGKEVIIEQ